MPLDTPLDVVRENDGSVRVLDGEALVVEARSAPELEVEVPAPVSRRDAHLAAAHYRGRSDGPFSSCFVCGRAREDAFGVFAGVVEGRQLVASPWTPPSWTADPAGRVLPEFVWAVLDCPTYFALYMNGELPISVLARLTARIDAPVVAGEEQVVIGWPIEVDGRKRHSGSAVLSPDGEVLAVARALLIEPRQGSQAAGEQRPIERHVTHSRGASAREFRIGTAPFRSRVERERKRPDAVAEPQQADNS